MGERGGAPELQGPHNLKFLLIKPVKCVSDRVNSDEGDLVPIYEDNSNISPDRRNQQDARCLYCDHLHSEDQRRESWIQCILWSHENCAGAGERQTLAYYSFGRYMNIEPSESRWSPLSMKTRKCRGIASALSASWVAIGFRWRQKWVDEGESGLIVVSTVMDRVWATVSLTRWTKTVVAVTVQRMILYRSELPTANGAVHRFNSRL
ncbi:hypothetical protein EVAR_87679_1 [Eumeta japonica]|uniref:Uncharacterized protein n=1 Tax=Eumeta variegata TaxID=151549 RepID=A0A4C1XL35_EUMVA|nr:hypothetical protein EVAR_87679_1 [Eumeta japonica]